MIPTSSFIAGAKGRLLPPSIIFRFFGAAVLFHVAMWLMLALSADQLPGFAGGPGSILAALHMLTLGVLAMTAIGAALQLLSVATKRPIRSFGMARLISWLYIPGVAILVFGMAAANNLAMFAGAGLTVLALLIFGGLIGDNLRGTKGMGVTIAHCWAALLSLVAVIVLGLLLITDYGTTLLPNHGNAALAHLILASFGFMGLLAMGFSYLLVPMFTLARPPSDRVGFLALTHSTMGLAFGVTGALADADWLLALAAVAGLAGAGAHLWGMARVYRARMRKRLGISFLLVRIGWASLPASLILGFALAAGWSPDGGRALFGIAVLGGWLLTFLLGILQRIIPFLASMHIPPTEGKPPTPADLTRQTTLHIHAACHLTALIGLIVGVVLDYDLIVLGAALAGATGSIAFAGFAGDVIRRLFPGRGQGQPATAARFTKGH
ncbi:MAG: hypothetical protein ACE5EM_11570 [Sphingomonadales bacterium]